MKRCSGWVGVLAVVSIASAGETMFTSGPQEFGGRKYYWLAEWKLEVTLPDDVGTNDKLEVLFGSKGSRKRTLHYEYDGKTGSLAHASREGFAWLELPLTELSGKKKVILSGKGRESVAFLAGVRIRGESTTAPTVKPVRTARISSSPARALVWADLPGFTLNDETRTLWDPSPDRPDWDRAERSARFAGIALKTSSGRSVPVYTAKCCHCMWPRAGRKKPRRAGWRVA